MHFEELRYNISYYGADYPVDSLVKRIHEGSIVVPRFQRGYVWKPNEASRFIESLLLGLPVPSIFLAKDKVTNELIIVDGQQRLKTLMYFYKGEFPDGERFVLKNVMPKYERIAYDSLPMSQKHQLDNTIIHSIIMKDEDNSDAIYHLFERLNTTGTPLASQEIRAAIYYGELNDLLFKLSKYENWEYIYGKKDNRLSDQEHILRFLALYFYLYEYKGNMLRFLNEFMMNYRMSVDEQFESIFIETVNFLKESIGEKVFSKTKSRFNSAVYDSTMVGTAKLISEGDIDVEKFIEFYSSLKEDDAYLNFTKSSTSNRSSLIGRIEYFIEKYKRYE